MIHPLLADLITPKDPRTKPLHKNTIKVSNTKIQIVSAWAQASIGSNGAAYITLINHGRTTTKLVTANTAIAERAELHRNQIIDNIVKMQHLSHIEIKPGRKLKMQPSELHVMLFGLKHKLQKGDKFSLNLIFENEYSINALVSVREIGAIDGSSEMNNKKTHSHKHMGH